MKKVLLVSFILAVIFLMGACSKGDSKQQSAGSITHDEIIIGNGTEPQGLDPAKVSGVPEHRLLMALFEGLEAADPKTGKAVPGVAESYSVSEEGTVYTFKLRKATWSDGTPITAQTFVDSWLRTLNPETASTYAYMIGMVVKGADEYNTGGGSPEGVAIRAVDEGTFEVTLVGPIPYFIDMLSHYIFFPVPVHAIEKFGDEWTKPKNFVGNGPFVLEEWVPNSKLTVVPNEKYWDKDVIFLSRVTFLPIEDTNTAYEKYKAGEIDWGTTIHVPKLDEVKLDKGYQVSPQVATYYYIFNTQKSYTKDPLVRKALSYAIDREELVSKITRGGQITATSIVPQMPGYTPSEGAGFDVEKAKALLAEAGYPNGKGLPKLTVIYNTNETHKIIAEYIQEVWKTTLGVEIEIKNYEWKTFLDVRREHDFEISRAGWVGDYQDPNTFLEMFVSGSGLNDPDYKNPKYDALLQKAATLPDGAERMNLMQEAEKLLITEDQVVMPLYFYVSQNLIDTDVWSGWYLNPLDNHSFKGLKKNK